jgi:hypothetical protein
MEEKDRDELELQIADKSVKSPIPIKPIKD